MTDTVIKGTGNSRSIKLPPNAKTQWPTWDAFLSDAISTGIPIDLLGLISAGVQTMGTPYNKANVLPNATCTNLGISTSAVPKDAFNALRTLVQTAQNTANEAKSAIDFKIATGSYVGTSNKQGNQSSIVTVTKTLTFPFPWWFVLVEGGGYGLFYVLWKARNVGTVYAPGMSLTRTHALSLQSAERNVIITESLTMSTGDFSYIDLYSTTYNYLVIGNP